MPQRLESLPTFTCIDDADSINLWPDARPSDWNQANAIGRARAEEMVTVIRRTQSPVVLVHVIEAIASKGAIGGVEVGFFHALSLELMNPEKIIEFVTTPPERQFRLGRKMGHLSVVQDNEDEDTVEQAATVAVAR